MCPQSRKQCGLRCQTNNGKATMLRNTFSGFGSVLIVLGWTICACHSHGQTLSFQRQFNVPEMNQTTAVAADASGVYVIGINWRSSNLGRSGLRKYDSSG